MPLHQARHMRNHSGGTALFDDILGVLVLYGRTAAESETFRSLLSCLHKARQAIDLVIFDNSPVRAAPLGEAWPEEFRVRYVSDTSNPGISRAYNRGFRIARQLQKKWLLLLDQDTSFPDQTFPGYFEQMEGNRDSVLFAPKLVCDNRLYSPCGQLLNINFHLRSVGPGVVPVKGKSILNSGMCISVNAFEEAGGFDERIPLDFADHDFIRRYKRHFDRFVVVDVVCQHGFSGRQPVDINTALTRFGYYCTGARNYVKGVQDTLSVFPIVLLRAIRLSLRHRSLKFLRLLFRASAKTYSQRPPAKECSF